MRENERGKRAHDAPFCDNMTGIINNPRFVIEIKVPKVDIIIDAPTKGDYNMMIQGTFTAQEYIKKYGICEEMPPLAESTADKFIEDVITALKEYREQYRDILGVPKKNDYSVGNEDEQEFPILTHADSLVYHHSGIDMIQQRELPVIEYWLLLADAIKIRLSESEKGREYLQDCYIDMHSQVTDISDRPQGVI